MGQRSSLVLSLFLSGCGLAEVLPGGPVVSRAVRNAYYKSQPPTVTTGKGEVPLRYAGGPVVPFVVLPFQVWGLRYQLDVVLVSDHPDWVMHEYAKVKQSVWTYWIAKDAGVDREQTITADIKDIESWLPEVPVRRISGPVVAQESGEDGVFQLDLSYTNPKNEPTTVRYVGPMPTEPSHPRNGNTMGHSGKTVAALLDLYLFRTGGSVDMTIGGTERKLKKLLGLVPEAFLLAQVQGGIAITNFRETESAQGFSLSRPGDGNPWPTHAEESWSNGEAGWVWRVGPLVTLGYRFDAGELEIAKAVEAGSAGSLTEITFSPRLPDVRRHFEGVAESEFIVAIDGQRGHGIGTVRTYWKNEEVRIEMRPSKPRWFADRPMDGRVRYEGGAAYVSMERVDVDPR